MFAGVGPADPISSRKADPVEALHGGRRLDHSVLLYKDLKHFLDVMVPFVESGVDGGDVTFVAARGDYLPALRDGLGSRANGAHLVDTNVWCPHPATRLRGFSELIRDEIAGGAIGCRFAGEPLWPLESPAHTREWQRYESVLNAVLAPYPVSLMCLYDATGLEPSILETARRTHPTSCLNGEWIRNPDFLRPDEFLMQWTHDLPSAPPNALTIPQVPDVSVARRFLMERAVEAGVGIEDALDLTVAANEIITNSFLYATRPTLSCWTQNGQFVCQIEDRGSGLTDPIASYRPPSDTGQHGRGLWMARQLVDLLQIHGGPTGTTVRLHVRRA
ncbi:MAG: hypothetical protein GEU71_07690 [Actinobacteria bacterium]|nr:hypothetical protein [Actinomycetota bacterium]